MVPIPSMLYEFDNKLIHQFKKIDKGQLEQLEEVKENIEDDIKEFQKCKIQKKDSKKLV